MYPCFFLLLINFSWILRNYSVPNNSKQHEKEYIKGISPQRVVSASEVLKLYSDWSN
jgi:hypothetical protein